MENNNGNYPIDGQQNINSLTDRANIDSNEPIRLPNTNQNHNDAFRNLLLDIILPVIILNQLSKRLGEHGPLIALLVALSLPVGHGLYQLIKQKKKNMISVLGIVNILLTGGLALLELEGFWFAFKEAVFPFVIGLAVLVSAYTSKPLVRLLLLNESFIKVTLINHRLNEFGNTQKFAKHLQKLTVFLALSFFMSAILNYVLAIRIFVQIPVELSTLERSTILNDQIAHMTWLSFVVIALPSMFFMAGIFWYLLHGIKKYAQLDFKEVVVGAVS